MMWKKRYPIDLAAIPTVDTAEFESLLEQQSGHGICIALHKVTGNTKELARCQSAYLAWQATHANVLKSMAYQRFVREKEEAANKGRSVVEMLRQRVQRDGLKEKSESTTLLR